MKKTVFYSVLLICEFGQLALVLFANPTYHAELLPLSWYAASPLLLLPPLCVFLLIMRVPESKLVRKLYGTAKLLQCIGFASYLYATFSDAVRNAFARISVMHLSCVTILLVYSGILSAITLKSDGESCK